MLDKAFKHRGEKLNRDIEREETNDMTTSVSEWIK